MVHVPGGTFRMGCDDFFPEERPAHPVSVDAFAIDIHPVTVVQFRRFVKATGYITIAERPLDPRDFPGAAPADIVPGALVFRRTRGPVPLDDWRRWWQYCPGADWRHPYGPTSNLDGRDRHPVTQVAYPDALAYAEWMGKQLPSEAEWEFAARGGLEAATYSWGDEFEPKKRRMANTWAGEFPWQFRRGRGQADHPDTTPVGSYPPNGYGLFDMTGNIWEWTTDPYTPRHHAPAPADCCAPRRSRGTPTTADPAATQPASLVIKGGSYLCAPNYCLRYRPAARQRQTEDTATCHLGFRCVLRGDPS
ncbi:formylglycine-generating enzyme family protein [Streptomyces sp. NBC_00385]|uniref:formylglycine-generating enzyme family protein n=1 Tax=Streptomyces sp. NBC_00385 TaxID=2975733 RepID=UPI002DDBAE75|nr:formylglycine-generating enzyme family protein [Streptomyces sp. NBC_00385]WRZ02670.1 formylglycine-generating enzyme family protein [Streptomyces sp. NBC_00385]